MAPPVMLSTNSTMSSQQQVAIHAYNCARATSGSVNSPASTEEINDIAFEVIGNTVKLLCPLGSLAMLIGGSVTCANDPDHSAGVGLIVAGVTCTSIALCCLAKKCISSYKERREEQCRNII